MAGSAARADRPVGIAVRPEVTEQVHHRRRGPQRRGAEGQPGQRPDLLFELADLGRLDRQVPGVMRPGRQLVDPQLPLGGEEELDRQNTDSPNASATARARSCAVWVTAGPIGAGMRVVSRMCRSCWFRQAG